MSPTPRRLRVGTRGSKLAVTQTGHMVDALRARWPDADVSVHIIKTEGDVRTDVPLSVIGGRGVFAAELEHALARGDVDLAIHSAKDLPSTVAPEFAIGAFPEREDPRDVVVSRGPRLMELTDGAVVGTSSPRRAAQLRALRPDLDVRDLRGNVDTRLRKLDAGEYDAILLAAAGLRRLGLQARITEYLAPDVMVPAVSQGALALEVRADDANALAAVAPLDHAPTRAAATAERAFLARLGAGCTAPTGAHVVLDGPDGLLLTAVVASADPHGAPRAERLTMRGDVADPVALGRRAGDEMIRRAGDLIAQVRGPAAAPANAAATAGTR